MFGWGEIEDDGKEGYEKGEENVIFHYLLVVKLNRDDRKKGKGKEEWGKCDFLLFG